MSTGAPTDTAPTAPVRVWDLPTRLCHWALAVCLIGSIATAYAGGLAMNWHFRFGYAIGALLLFRLVWGFIGGRWSRFASFLYGPRTLWAYLRGDPQAGRWLDVGHSPLGALSVFALLLVLALQVGTGLFADDEIAFAGPLTRFVSADTVYDLTWYHQAVGQWLVIGLVALHLAAILFYTVVLRRRLVGPMLVGDKPLPPDTPASRDGIGSRLAALAVLVACAGLVAWVVDLGSF